MSGVFALVSVCILLATYTDRPVLWLLIGTRPPCGPAHPKDVFAPGTEAAGGLLAFYERDQ